MIIRLSFLCVSLICIVFSAQAQASEPRLIATYDDWSAYMFVEGGNKVCYMASQPKKDEGDYTSRGEIFALITHRPSEGTRDVFSYITGYPYKTGSDVSVTIGGSRFTMFTQDDTAWAPDAAADRQLASAIRKGSNMVVKGTSQRGTLTTDTFSLRGSGKAYDTITRECGL
ncbi:MAG: invasion associated locus B family protein [Pseudomonadota bacterium]